MQSVCQNVGMNAIEIAPNFDGPVAWTRDTLAPSDGIFPLSAECLAELDDVAKQLAENPFPTVALRPDMFPLPACYELMSSVQRTLRSGMGFAILDRLPVDRYGRDISITLYWLLCSMVARPVAQKWNGRMIYDVLDTGQKPGNGVRPDITNAEQNFHTDNSYNLCPPDYVTLLCLQTSARGGISRIVSFSAVHNIMRQEHSDLLARLYAPYVFDRQREHAPEDEMTTTHPLFQYEDGRLAARLSRFQVKNGYALAGEQMDAIGADALDALEGVMNRPEFWKEFHFEPGQIQLIDNRRLGHKRTGFIDSETQKRHLVRLWLRSHGRPFYNG